MKSELERRVHELLDAGRDPAEDPQVRTALADDGEARAEVAALSKLEGWLRDWEVAVPEEDLEPIAQRIEQRLDEAIDSFDATAAPTFDDPDAKVSPLSERGSAVRSGEYSLDALAGAVEAPTPAQMTGPSPAVRLSAPPRPERRRGPVGPWIAAAAVAVLGVMVGVATLQQASEPAPVASEAAAPQAVPAAPPAESPEPEAWAAEEAEEEAPLEQTLAEATDEAADTEAERGADGTVEGSAPETATTTRRARSTMSSASASPRATGGGRAVWDTLGAGGAPPPMRGEAAPEAEPGGVTAAVRGAVERSRAGVRACIGSGTDSAVVMVRFRDGTVRDARVLRPTANDGTNQCVAAALRRARVRPEGGQARRTLYYRWGAPAN